MGEGALAPMVAMVGAPLVAPVAPSVILGLSLSLSLSPSPFSLSLPRTVSCSLSLSLALALALSCYFSLALWRLAPSLSLLIDHSRPLARALSLYYYKSGA
jgi:hypothetical protein